MYIFVYAAKLKNISTEKEICLSLSLALLGSDLTRFGYVRSVFGLARVPLVGIWSGSVRPFGIWSVLSGSISIWSGSVRFGRYLVGLSQVRSGSVGIRSALGRH